VELLPLRPSDVALSLADRSHRNAGEGWPRLLGDLDGSATTPVTEALSSPLAVSLFLRAYDGTGRDPGELLDRDRFPDADTIRRLLFDYLTRAAAATAYSPDDPRRWLSFLARHMVRLKTYDLAWWQLHRALSPSLV